MFVQVCVFLVAIYDRILIGVQSYDTHSLKFTFIVL